MEQQSWGADARAGVPRSPGVERAIDELHSPSIEDPVIRGASAAFGGPIGTHVRRGWSWWNPLRVLVLLAILGSVLMYGEKLPCRGAAWQGGFQYSHMCYTDIYPLYSAEGLSQPDRKRPYLDAHLNSEGKPTYVEYPVLIGAAMEVAAVLSDHSVPHTQPVQRFLDITWMMIMVAAVAAVVATALTHRRRMWDAAMLALAPGWILAGLINWDVLAVGLTALAMLAWARKHTFVSGLLFGLAIATKFYPVVFFAPLFVLCLRGGRMRSFFSALGGAALAWAIVDVPVWIRSPDGFLTFYKFSRRRGADWGSTYYFVERVFNVSIHVSQLNIIEAGATTVVVLLVAALTLAAPRRPRLPQVFFVTLAAFLLVNKVDSPQYVVWLVPLFVLARPRWRAFLAWQFAEVVYFMAVWLFLMNVERPGKGLEWQPYMVALAGRDVALLAMVVLVVIDMFRPDRDVVRMDGSDDPAGGVLDGAPDYGSARRTYHEPVAVAQLS